MIYFPEDLAWIGLTNSHLEKSYLNGLQNKNEGSFAYVFSGQGRASLDLPFQSPSTW